MFLIKTDPWIIKKKVISKIISCEKRITMTNEKESTEKINEIRQNKLKSSKKNIMGEESSRKFFGKVQGGGEGRHMSHSVARSAIRFR